MKSLQEQINEQIEFGRKLCSENKSISILTLDVDKADPKELSDLANAKNKEIRNSGDTLMVAIHREGNFSVWVKSVPVKINTQITYETL